MPTNETLEERAPITPEALGLTKHLSNETKLMLGRNATETASSTAFEWGGGSAQEFLLTKLNEAKSKVLGDKKGPAIPDQKQQIVDLMVGTLRGFAGERVSAQLTLSQAETLSVIEGSRQYSRDEIQGILEVSESRIEDVAKIFGGTRKDVIMVGIRLAEKIDDKDFLDAVVYESGVDVEKAKTIVEAIAGVGLNYNGAVEKYKQSTSKKDAPQIKELFRSTARAAIVGSHVAAKGSDLNNKENRAVDFVVSEGYKMLDRGLAPFILYVADEISPVDKKAAVLNKAIRQHDRSYQGITLPDGLISKDKQVKAIVEMKAYTFEEVNQWIEWLTDDTNKYEQGSTFALINGLQVTHLEYTGKHTDKPKAMTFGADIDAERNFVTHLLKDVSQIEVPVVIRFPNSISERQIEQLHDIAVMRGLTNMVFQRLPVTLNGVHKVAQKLVTNIFDEVKNLKEVSNTDVEILLALKANKTWGFE